MLGLVIPISDTEGGVVVAWAQNEAGEWYVHPDPMDPVLAAQTLEDARLNDGYVWYRDLRGDVGIIAARTVWHGYMQYVSREGMVASVPDQGPVQLSGFDAVAELSKGRSKPAA